MKKIFNIITFFFILAVSLILTFCIETHTTQVNSSDYIREIKNESVFLISCNTVRSELSSRQSDNNMGQSSLFPYLLSFISSKFNFEKLRIGFNTNCIYILFNNLRKIYKIRAP